MRDPDTFLYNTGADHVADQPELEPQAVLLRHPASTGMGRAAASARDLACPPCNIGPLSTPNYAAQLAQPAVHTLSDGSTVFAGQRAEGFYVDLGSIFDLGDLRPIQELHVFPRPSALKSMPGVNATKT